MSGQVPASMFHLQRSMWDVGLSLFLFLLIFLLTPTRLQAQDTLILKNGRKADCRILDFTADAVKISYRASPNVPFADRLIPLTDVDYVELAPLPGEPEALAQAVREGRSEPLISYWVKRLPWLNRPRTNTGEIGLTYAELLTRVATADRRDRALKIYEQIEASDWSTERRGRAQAGKLRVMLRQGRTSEVRPLAEGLLQTSGDPRVLIELRHVMAEASAAALTQLEKDHPRWQEEEDLVPHHTQLLNDALDGYLYPHLFHGAEEDMASRGLWAAAQLSAAQKLITQAADWSTDLKQLYPTQPEATAAQSWLEKQALPALSKKPLPLPAKGAKGDPGETDETDETDESDETDEEGTEEISPAPQRKATRASVKKPAAASKAKSKAGKDTDDE